jgi:hypothetical protein
MLASVLLGRVFGMFDRVQLVSMRQMRVMTGFVVITILGVLGCFAMMLGSFFQMFCRFVVMMMNLVFGVHATLLDKHAPGPGSQALPANQITVSRL